MYEQDALVLAHKGHIAMEEVKAGYTAEVADPLDPQRGYFASEIKALNDSVPQHLGRSMNPGDKR
jgi:hypothetical protein